MSRVMVTGASGFVGAAAVRALLQQGDGVVAVVQPGTSTERLRRLSLQTVSLELEDCRAVETALAQVKPETILHAAWYARPEDYLVSPKNLDSLRATTDLFQAAVRSGCHRFVGIGTCLEYARSDLPRREEALSDPRSLYASCKLSAWLLCRALAAKAGVSLAWARLFYLHGPDENQGRFLPALVNTLRAGRPFPMTAGEQVRDYMHVDDTGRALALLCHPGADGLINIASGQPTTLREFALTAATLLDAGALVGLGELPKRPDEEMFMVADVTRLCALGFQPRHTSLQDGLGHTLQHWKTP